MGLLPGAVVAFAVLTTLDLPNWRNELSWTALTIRTDPTSRFGWEARADHYVRTGEDEKAIGTWRTAAESVTSDADRAAFLERIGTMEAERGRFAQSMSAFERIAAIPGSEANGFIGIGNLYWTMRRREDALEAYDAALRHEPANALALANRARLSEALGDVGAAVAHYRRLLTLPETPSFHDVRAHAERYVRRHAGR